MGLTALWTGVHYRVPVLIVVANNESFFNDELHQERMARLRGRPIENRWIGLRMSDPALDLAQLARGQGARGYGPVRTAAELDAALAQAVADVHAGRVAVVDARLPPNTRGRCRRRSCATRRRSHDDASDGGNGGDRARPAAAAAARTLVWRRLARIDGGARTSRRKPGHAHSLGTCADASAEDVDRAVAADGPRSDSGATCPRRSARPRSAARRRSCAGTATSSRGSRPSTPATRSRRCASTSTSARRTWTTSPGSSPRSRARRSRSGPARSTTRCASRWASSAASARSTTRCSSLPANAARRSPPATRSSSSRRTRRRSHRCESQSCGRTCSRPASSTS